MKYLIWILLIFFAAIVLAVASHEMSYVLFVYPPYRIEMSFLLFALIYIFVFFISYVLLRLTLTTLKLPSFVRNFRLERSQNKARKLLNDSLNAYFEGRYATAERISAKAIKNGEVTGLHPIIAARAAHELHEFDKRDTYLAMNEGKSAGDTTMRLMSKARFQLDQKQPEKALGSLKELSESGIRKHVGALNLELKAQQLAKNWDEVLELVKKLERQNAIDSVSAEQIRLQAWHEKLRESTLDITALNALWKSVPGRYKDNARILSAAVQAFCEASNHRKAQRLLSDFLNSQWDSRLVALYGDCSSGDATEQIEQAEKWLNQHNQDAKLLLALGKLCMHQKLWGKAQNYIDASISLEPSYESFNALGQLAEKMGKRELAQAHFQKALQYAG